MTAAKSSLRRAKPALTLPSNQGQCCLEQAEICREQARDAARLKRFGAAFGLFNTAATLCRHVCCIAPCECDEPTRDLASQRLHQIDIEVATYAELARSAARH